MIPVANEHFASKRDHERKLLPTVDFGTAINCSENLATYVRIMKRKYEKNITINIAAS